MIKKRLLSYLSDSKKYIYYHVVLKWISLLSNVVMIAMLSLFIEKLYYRNDITNHMIVYSIIMMMCLGIRYLCSIYSSKMSYLSSKQIKQKLRHDIYAKILKLGSNYHERMATSKIVQVCSEGIDQLQTYYSNYLPQFFYSMIAPITLFLIIAFIDLTSAMVLLICVPLIPVSIILVQKFAKKLLNKYWGVYTSLGDSFLENIQGLTTLKIYQADEMKHQQMNEEAQQFRKITMKVLTMQLNSISVMDFIAYGGGALGAILAILAFQANTIGIGECIFIILISADFFIPMRLLGSYFHIAMNGIAASDIIFELLDLEEQQDMNQEVNHINKITIDDLTFSYDQHKKVLNNIHLTIRENGYYAIEGESGCGKSTLASLLMKRNEYFQGNIKINDIELKELNEKNYFKQIVYISNKDYLFKGTIKENLLMGKLDATDEQLWDALVTCKCDDFLTKQDLEKPLLEKASNLSGGQCQRIALARALLHNAQVMIFDEATSNIDVESEKMIIEVIKQLSKDKIVIMISHSLENVKDADMIYVMKEGMIMEQGKHNDLYELNQEYRKMYDVQKSYIDVLKEGEVNVE